MSVDELVEQLQALADNADEDNESAHVYMDRLLFEFIGDPRVKHVYDNADIWYS